MSIKNLMLFVGVFCAFMVAFTGQIQAQTLSVKDYIPWDSGDTLCSYTVTNGYRECYTIINISNPTNFDITTINSNKMQFSLEKNAFVYDFYIFSPHLIDKYTDCPETLNSDVCSWKNGTVIWKQEKIVVNWEKIGSDASMSLSKDLPSLNIKSKEKIQIKVVGKKKVGDPVKWTFCIGSYCIDPLWSDPAGDAMGWYNLPDDFNVPNIAAADINDQLFFNLTNANDAGGQSLRAKDDTETQTGAYAYLWRSGFTEGCYSLRFTGLNQDAGVQSNSFTLATQNPAGTWYNYSIIAFDWVGANYLSNTSTNIGAGGNDGLGVRACVNSSGILDFMIWANSSSTSWYTRISALNVTNYTATGGGPPANAPPNYTAQTTNFTKTYDTDPTNFEFNVTWTDTDDGVNSAWLYHNIGQNWGMVKMVNTTPTAFFLTVTKSVKAGTYYYMFFANDTTGDTNQTINYSVTVTKATPSSPALSVAPAWTVTDGTSTTVTCTASDTPDLYADESPVANPHTTVLALGSHNYTCIVDLGIPENYSTVSTQHDLTVSETGFGCTNETTWAFRKDFTNVPRNYASYDFSDVVDAGLVKPDLSDVYTDDANLTLLLNMTYGKFLVVNLSGDDGNFTIYFGNYYANYSYANYAVTYNDSNMSGYTENTDYYTISLLNEVTGVGLNPPNSSKYMRIYCTGGSSYVPIDNTTTRFVLATYEIPSSFVFHIGYSTNEYYWRELIPTDTVQLMEFYLVDANTYQVAEMILTVEDYTGSYSTGDKLIIKKWLQGSLKTVTESELDIENKILAYLMVGEKYGIYLDNDVLETTIGNLLVDTNDLTKTILIGSFPLTNEQLGNIRYNLTMDNTTGAIKFFYFDPTNLTYNVSLAVYNYTNGSLLYYTYSANHSEVNFNYVVPDANQSYRVNVHVSHGYFGENSLLDLWRVFTGLATFITPSFATVPGFVMTAIGTISLIGIAMTFGARQGAFGGIMVALFALMYVFVGWYAVPVEIVVLAVVLAIMNKFREVKS